MRAALILAGGRGERFWPWSRPGRPKQLLPLADGEILLEATLGRLEGLVAPEHRIILTGRDLTGPVSRLVGSRARVVAEPVGRNTAPAVGLAALLARAVGATGAMAVLPADHRVAPLSAFQSDVRTALELAETQDRLVTFGVRPAWPETGYGYIERGDPLGPERAYTVRSFREKPDAPTATRYIRDGRYLWNSGMFFWRPDVVLVALARHRPDLARALDALVPGAEAWARGDAPAFDASLDRHFAGLESISIDYAIMERAENAAVIEASFEWDDVGSWTSWARRQTRDARGNVTQGRAVAIESDNCVVLAGGAEPVVVLGGRDLIVVQQDAGTLVCPIDRGDDVRKAATEIERRGWSSAEKPL